MTRPLRRAAPLLLVLTAVSGTAQEAPPRAGEPGVPAPPSTAARPVREPLGLSEAVEAALATHPAVAQARDLRAAAAGRSAEAVAARRPEAVFNAQAARYEEPAVVTPIHGFAPGLFPEFDRSVGRAEVAVRYDLYDGGAAAARLASARAGEEAAGETVAAAEDELVALTVATYVRVQSLAAVADAHDRRLAAFAAERGRVEQLFAVGRAAEVDRKRIGAALAAAEAERVALAAALDTAERGLARLTGRDAEATRAARLRPVRLDGVPPAARAELAELALAANPRVAGADARAAAAETAVELARSLRRPRLAARGAYQEYASSDGLEAGEWQAGLELRLPLFDGGVTAARVSTAEAERDAARAAAEAARLAVLDELDRTLADLERATARVESLAEAVAGYGEVARVEALRLAHGAGTQPDLLDAEADVLAARAELAEARFARIAATTEIGRLTGSLDAGWVAAHLDPAVPGPAGTPEAP